MGCTSGVIKCTLNLMNVLVLLFGAGLLILATLILSTAPPMYVYFLYAVGALNFILAMLGCCGICKEDVCMTTAYAILILASLVTQIVGKIYSTDSEAIRKFASEDIEKTWLEEIKHPGAMDKPQSTYHCCGKNSPNDYFSINRQTYPNSCYPHQMVNQTLLYNTGCIQAAQDNFLQIFNYSSTGQWSNLVFTAILFVFALYLVIRFRRKQRRYNY